MDGLAEGNWIADPSGHLPRLAQHRLDLLRRAHGRQGSHQIRPEPDPQDGIGLRQLAQRFFQQFRRRLGRQVNPPAGMFIPQGGVGQVLR